MEPANIPPLGIDHYSPAEIADRVEAAGVIKARLPFLKLFILGLLAGGFIGLGAMYYTIVAADHALPFAVGRILGGLVFSLGLVLVVVAGAELFTGNNLIVMAWADGKVSTGEVLRNWAVVLVANGIGAAGLAWLAMAARSVTDKILAVVFPISAFVAAGFEHSIANFYFIPLAMLLAASGQPVPVGAAIDLAGMAANLVPVTLGNLAGGAILVAGVYWIVWRKA